MPQFTCPCGKSFIAARANARYCSDRCRKRTKRSGADVVELPEASDSPKVGPIQSAARRELENADRLDTSLGLTAIALAIRLDHGLMETGSAYSALSKEFKATLAEATKGGKATAPQQLRDELAERRAKHA